MPAFETPEPIAVTLEIAVGDVHITATDRADTLVEIGPSNKDDESDVKAAQQITVDHAKGTLRVTGPKRSLDFSRKAKSVQVSIELPSGSQVSARMQVGDVHCAGRLGECRIKTSVGHLRVEQTGQLRLETSAGNITAEDVDGNAEISTGSGKVRIGGILGSAVVKNSNGETVIDAVSGDVKVRAANGDIRVDRAGADVDAKTSNGGVRVGEVSRGAVVLESAMGDLEIGIAEGTAAHLAVKTGFGNVRNLLEHTSRPEKTDETAEVRAHTGYGDITIRRA